MRTITIMAAILFVSAPALAEDWDFILTNESGKPIKKIDLAVSGTDEWKPNIKAEEIADKWPLKVRERTTIHLDKPSGKCRFDIRATFADDTTQVWTGTNICDNSYVTIRLAGGKPTVSAN